jgi:hypothetical protein
VDERLLRVCLRREKHAVMYGLIGPAILDLDVGADNQIVLVRAGR